MTEEDVVEAASRVVMVCCRMMIMRSTVMETEEACEPKIKIMRNQQILKL